MTRTTDLSLAAKSAAMAQLAIRIREISQELGQHMEDVKKLPVEFRAIYG